MGRRSVFSFHVCAVTVTIAYIYLTSIFFFTDQWLGLWSSSGMLTAAFYTLVAVMCIFCYCLAICTEPGWVPSSFMPDVEDSNYPIHEIKRKGGDLRYCQKCSHYKPPRAHHCRLCSRCVLRMDHHCIWINNCVGHANYKIFFVFIFYAVIACFYSLVLLVGSFTVTSQKDFDDYEDPLRIIHVISGLLLVPLSLTLGFFLGWHIYLIARNKTTIEYHEGVRAMWLAEKGGDLYSHPYDIGAYENLTTILGPNILCWIFPSSRHIGSGLFFQFKRDSLIGTLHPE